MNSITAPFYAFIFDFDDAELDTFLAWAWHDFWAQVAIAALLTREHRRWLAYGGLTGPGEGQI